MTKNYINPPLNYMGGKFKLLPQIDPLLDKTKHNFYDVFAGGGSVFMNVGLNYSTVYVNDLLSAEIHKELHNNGEFFTLKMKSHLVDKEDKEGYLRLRDSYNTEPTPEKLWALILSCNSNMMRFNKDRKFNQTFGKRTFNPSTEKKLTGYMNRVKEFSNISVNFSSKPYDKLPGYYASNSFIGSYFDDPNGMVYLDPPLF